MNARVKGYILCFFGVLTWSFSEVIAKLLQGAVGPISLSFYRFFFGALFLLILLAFQGNVKSDFKDLKIITIKYPKILFLSSAIGLGISNIIYFFGLKYTQANIGAALYTTYPLFISIYSIFILKERSNLRLKFLGYIIGFTGTFILMTNFNFSLFLEPQNMIGNLMLVAAAAIWAFYSVLGKKIFRAEQQMPGVEIKFTIVSFIVACIPIFIVLLFSSELSTFMQHPLWVWGWILFLACISTGLGLYIFFIGVRSIEVTHGMSLSLLKPLMATILAYLILSEPSSIALWISIILVSIAVTLINRLSKAPQIKILEKEEI
jgi:drug/metabolite transporter (DMT)-like permease